MHIGSRLVISLSALGLAAACGSKSHPAPTPVATDPGTGSGSAAPSEPSTPAVPAIQKQLADVGLDGGLIDRSVDPCDDFYQFACGNWIKQTEIAADKPMAMRSFVDIDDRNQEYLHDVLEQARTAPKGADAATTTLGAFYGACMDEPAIAKAGTTPIAPLVAAIAKVKDGATLAAATSALHRASVEALFTFGPIQDAKNATQVIGNIDQGGLGLPDRDYYLNDDAQSVGLRGMYQGFVATMLGLSGMSPAAAKTGAADVMAVETAIAKISKDKVARRDPVGTYNRLDRQGVIAATKHFDWAGYWKGQGVPAIDAITVTSPEFLAGLDGLITTIKPAQWRAYLTFHLYVSAAPLLDKKFDDAAFAFTSVLTGQPAQPPRWKRCVRATDGALGDLLGAQFVKARFAGSAKDGALGQIQAISAAMKDNLAALPWMDAKTKDGAFAKLAKMTYQIGYPNAWKSYAFPVDAHAYAKNALAAIAAEHARQLGKIGKPVDKDDWQMTASTVNAYYDPSLNGMVFPAGILQPPFFNPDASVAVNLGGMGMVVGHELTHGFDDQGAQYDGDGNLKSWWASDTAAKFKAKTQCVVEQYNAYEAVPGVKLNGANTQGENIADIGGVKLAYRAYHALRAGQAPIEAEGFTEDQTFFLGFGQAWCAKVRPDLAKLLATVDVHSPPEWRVNGALSATPEFAQAFHCKAGAKLRPATTCQVW